MIPKANNLNNEDHRRFVARHLCCVCLLGTLAEAMTFKSQAAHVRYLGTCGTGMKPGDDCCVPLCVSCHREQHAFGNEREWWRSKGIDPRAVIEDLCERSPHIKVDA